MIENEIKLCWLGQPPQLPAILGPALETRTLVNTYFDTPKRALAAQGYGLRLRQNGTEIEQTLKGSASHQDGIVVRQEWNWLRPELSIDPSVLPVTVDALEVVSTNRVSRQVWVIQGCEVVMDQGQVQVGQAASPIAEIEIEALESDWSGVQALAKRLAQAFPCYIGSISKAERGHLLAGRDSPADQSPLDGLGRALDTIKGPDWARAESYAAQISPAVLERIQARDANVAALCL